MQVEYPYKSLKDTLQKLKQQVIDSLPYIHKYIPQDIATPEDLFYFLRDITRYKNDPKGIELLQCVQTLMDRDGKGDCDCFTILVLASCYYLGFKPQQVRLKGNKKYSPSHIYSLVWDKSKNRMCSMDLTNPYYDTERTYKYTQTLDFMMTLRLEDGMSSRASRKANKTVRKENKKVRVATRQGKRTGRTVNKAQRKSVKQKVKVGKKDKKLIKVKGRQDVIKARAQSKIDNVQNKQGQNTYDPSFDPSSDQIPNTGIYPGGDYEASSGSGQDVYDDYELLPGEEEEQEMEGDEGMSSLVGGIIKGANNFYNKLQTSKAGQAVQKGTSKYNDLMALQQENATLKTTIAEGKRTTLMTAGGSGIAGLVAGFVLAKVFK